MERPFEEEEVFKALGEMCGDRAPGPDGFTIAFYKKCWGVVKDDFMKVLLEFHKDASLERSANATFIALIPKKGEAVDIRDFRPISLVGSLYKRIAKVLASRMNKAMSLIISPHQSAFVQGRQILE